jgi:hypothetical protein
MRVDDFALARGATAPVTAKQSAERVWEPKFLGEVMSGRDPHTAPIKPVAEGALTVAEFLDKYFTNYVEAECLKSATTISGHIKALKASLGNLPAATLEKSAEVTRFKAAYRQGHEVATVNRALGVLRAAINWGRFQIRRSSRQRRSIVSASPSRPGTKRSGTGASTATRSSNSWRRLNG